VVHGYPIKAPMLDIHTVGAGGGSIAHVDSGGLLKVGPRSAGADPGPACYGRGNPEPVVTDANLMLGILHPTHLLGGRLAVDRGLSVAAVEALAGRLGLGPMETAQGILSIVTANMAKAIRVISVQRGHDPRDYTLMAFGGAGPLHAARLARELEMRRVLVPRNPGILCAMGLLLTDLRADFAVTRLTPLAEAALAPMAAAFADLAAQAEAWFAREGVAPADRRLTRSIDMRYAGQNYELPIPLPELPPGPALLAALAEGFAAAHARAYGFTAAEEPVQLVTFRLEATGLVPKARLEPAPLGPAEADAARIGTRRSFLPEAGGFTEVPVYDRARLAPGHAFPGPAIIEQMDSTTLVLPGMAARVDGFGNLILEDGA
jgi:N-methylhydantoinase A